MATNELPEVIVTPEPWQIDLKKRMPWLARMNFLEDAKFRSGIPSYNKEGWNDEEKKDEYVQNYMHRLYNMYKEANFPVIKEGYTGKMNGRPYILPNIYGSSNIYDTRFLPKHIITEIAHPLQSKYGTISLFSLKSLSDQFRRHILNQKSVDRKMYRDKNSFEYQTHSEFQPEIENYIYKNIKPKWLNN